MAGKNDFAECAFFLVVELPIDPLDPCVTGWFHIAAVVILLGFGPAVECVAIEVVDVRFTPTF